MSRSDDPEITGAGLEGTDATTIRDARAFSRLLSRSVTLPLLLAGLVAGVLVIGAVYLINLVRLEAHTADVIRQAHIVDLALGDMEAGLRGYVLTGDSRFLAQHREALERFRPALEQLSAAVSDNPAQQRRLGPVLEGAAGWEQYASELLERYWGGQDWLALVREGRGRETMRRARSEMEAFIATENDRLARRSDRVWRGAATVVGACVALVLALGGAVALVGRRQLVQLAASYGHAQQAAMRRARELGESEARLAAIIASAMDAIISIDDSHRVVVFNEAASRAFGWSAEEAVGQPLDRFIPERLRDTHRAHLEAFAATGETSRTMGRPGQLVALHRDGHEFPIEATISKVVVGGSPLFTVILRDLTERVAAERALHESEERFRLLIDGVQDYAIFLLDPEGRVASWNSGAERIHGYTAEEVIGRSFSQFFLPDDRQSGVPDRVLEQAQRAGRISVVGRRLRKDGEPFWADTTTTALRWPDGTLRGFAKVTRDITAQREAEERLRSYAARLEAVREIDRAILDSESLGDLARAALARLLAQLPESTRALVLLFDTQAGTARLEAAFPEPARSSRFQVGETVPLDEVGHPSFLLERRLRHQPDLAQQRSWPGLFARHLAEGDRAVLAISLVADGALIGELRLASPRPHAFSPEHRDMTSEVASQFAIAVRQTRLREELRTHAEELEARIAERTRAITEVNAELNAFAYSVSHDLRAPLRAMQGFAQALVEDYGPSLDPTARDWLGRIVDSSRRMDALIQDLLAYSRVTREELTPEPVDLTDVLAEVHAQIAPILAEGGARVDLPDRLPLVRGHRGLLVQVLGNLLTNAAKFARPGVAPHIRLRHETQNGVVRVWVEDNGIGIAPEHRERIFRVFERLHAPEQYPGTGIGLAIVRKGMDRMGGRVGLESTPGEGSRFWIELPAESVEENRVS